jgi:uncharacterized OB-fold protein
MFTLPPEPVCVHCGGAEAGFQYVALSGRGVIRSWTVVRQSFLPGFDDDLPFALVDVELAEQSELRMIGRLLDASADELRIGADAQVAFEQLAPGIAVPAFCLIR